MCALKLIMSHKSESSNVPSLKDERGYNQGFKLSPGNYIRMQRRWDFIAEHVRTIRSNPAEMTVVELGCSHGQWTRYLVDKLGCKGHGLDISELFVSMANAESQGSLNPTFSCVDFMDEDAVLRLFKPGSIDAIVGNGVLHHFEPELDRALRLIHRLLKPGGRMVFIEPNLLNPYVYGIFTFAPLRKLASLEPNEMAFTRWNIHERVMAAGFGSCKTLSGDFLLPDTAEWLVKPVLALDAVLERTYLREIAQSVFVVAEK